MPLLSRFKIKGHSMEPTLREGDDVLISSIPFLFSKPKTGDIIAFKDTQKGKVLIKRITEIKNNEYKVLGDNPRDSLDSRSFGRIGKKDIIGKVVHKLKVQS